MLNVHLKIHEDSTREVLKELLPQAGININEMDPHVLLYTPPKPESLLPSLNLSGFSFPIRLFDLLTHIENLPFQKDITFAHFSLDIREKMLKNLDSDETQRLTEKEVQLLRFFHNNRGQEVSKETLLKEIWEYHPDAETHTLETHIYRLRQKLEEDPNTPQILLNGKLGYRLKP